MKLALTIKKKANGQSGFGLVETLVAVALLGTAVVGFVTALSTGSLSVREQDQEITAQRLGQNQFEYIKSQGFSPAGSYSLISVPSGYTLNLSVAGVSGADADIQLVTVTVLRSGNSVFEISGYKVNR